MPTRKQRRRVLKERRHDYEYETVWIDPVSGEEVEPPEDYVPEAENDDRTKREGAKPKPKAKATQKRGDRPVRVPPPPSWQRAAKRAVLIGVVVFVFIYIAGSRSGGNSYARAFLTAAIYTLAFIPFQYWLDRFMYNRWQRRAEQQGQKPAAKKR
jgi:hypothetical protein